MTTMPGQLDLIDTLMSHGSKDDRKNLDQVVQKAPFIDLPEQFWGKDKSSDWWYGQERCIGCGQISDRKGLSDTHGVRFDEAGVQSLPPGPHMAEDGVCLLMSFAARHAIIAEALASGDERYGDYRRGRRCYKHDIPKGKKTCPKSCLTADAEHKAQVADEVWGGDAWRQRSG